MTKLGKTEAEKILFAIDEEWLEQRQEEVIEPGLPIIDPHHHLWDRGSRYLLDELLADIGSGHNITATMFMQCDSMVRAGGDPAYRSLGETEFVNGVAAMSASGGYGPARACVGIVGFAALTMGAGVARVLEAHLAIAPRRFKGVRYCSVWDADKSIKLTPRDYPKELLLDATFREGFAQLAPYGLTFDALVYHTQLPELTDLARAFPHTTVVLDHVGIPLAIGAHAGKRDEVFAEWKRGMEELARCPNAHVKLGGMGMHVFGFGFEEGAQPPSSADLAAAWKPYVETCIEAFGPGRCMFESNFPVDKRSTSYGVLWNAFKRLAAGCSEDEKTQLFADTARRVYRLDA